MQNTKLTPEQQEDVNSRVLLFQEGYKKLVEETQVDTVIYPQYIPVGDGSFITRSVMNIVDTKYLSKEVAPETEVTE